MVEPGLDVKVKTHFSERDGPIEDAVRQVYVFEYRPGRVATYIDGEFDHVYHHNSHKNKSSLDSTIKNIQTLVEYILSRLPVRIRIDFEE